MIDEEPLPVLRPDAADHYGEALLYDYGKFLTTLSLLVLGGILTLSQSDGLEGVKPSNLAVVIICIVMGGLSALSIVHSIVSARQSGKAPNHRLRFYMLAAPLGLGLGLGGFINIFWNALR